MQKRNGKVREIAANTDATILTQRRVQRYEGKTIMRDEVRIILPDGQCIWLYVATDDHGTYAYGYHHAADSKIIGEIDTRKGA